MSDDRDRDLFVHGFCMALAIGIVIGVWVPFRHLVVSFGAGALTSGLVYGWKAWRA